MAAWSDPPAELRPLQIVHGLKADDATVAAMKGLKELGLGGIVCNVSFSDYLASEPNWKTLSSGIDACREAGLVVWIYDEEGYPSGSAGGLVLKEKPAFEAQVLAYDPSRADPFVVRRAYEHTHASNNFHAARRYPNIIDEQAVRAFVNKTHDAYWDHLQKHFGTTIRAFFTDEPSLMAVDTGQLPESVRSHVKVDDPLDPSVRPLPTVPWAGDLPEVYRRRYGQDLMAVRRSLFAGEDESDRQVRRRFWGLIADLTADRYFGELERWCKGHGVASSGHSLWEEAVLHHVPLEGNALKCLRRMHIPGLDMLSSEPQQVVYEGWLTALLPASAALAEGRRQVMTEVSDFAELQAGKGPSPLAEMQATAAWQAALGVTEFTLYYNGKSRPAGDYRAYNDFVGRLNALLREARPAPTALLYYPIYDLWADYRPVAGPLKLESQPKHVQQVVQSFLRLGRELVTSQVPFALADHEVLSEASVRDGRLWVGKQAYVVVLLPKGVQLPEKAAGVVSLFQAEGGLVIWDGAVGRPSIRKLAESGLARGVLTERLEPASDRIVLGRFMRNDREILLLVNVAPQAYAGVVHVERPGNWWQADPVTGRVERAFSRPGEHGIQIALPARGTAMLVGPEGGGRWRE